MAFVQTLLPALDLYRGVMGQLGFRPFTVFVVGRQWTGARPGLGTSSDTTTPQKVDLGQFATKVVQLKSNEIIASGGLYHAQDMRVGPITPPYSGSGPNGTALSVFDPPQGVALELFFKITGPGYPASGQWFKKVSQDVSRVLAWFFVVRATGQVPV